MLSTKSFWFANSSLLLPLCFTQLDPYFFLFVLLTAQFLLEFFFFVLICCEWSHFGYDTSRRLQLGCVSDLIFFFVLCSDLLWTVSDLHGRLQLGCSWVAVVWSKSFWLGYIRKIAVGLCFWFNLFLCSLFWFVVNRFWFTWKIAVGLWLGYGCLVKGGCPMKRVERECQCRWRKGQWVLWMLSVDEGKGLCFAIYYYKP